ncbi:CoA-transferase [Streptomyces sp. NPDC051554]|uniref:CoA-transferase n=1 Tax=Streptomyces sp. NPDC051554 TaxID=3365656 RepID=UPI00379072F0
MDPRTDGRPRRHRTHRRLRGAMDLIHGARWVIVLMEHTAKDGTPKILKECTPPLTGERCVHHIITDLGVLDVTPEGLTLVARGPGVTAEDIADRTDAPLIRRPRALAVRPASISASPRPVRWPVQPTP